MKKSLIITLAVIFGIGLLLYWMFGGSYNKMVAADEGVQSAWAQVQNVYQRRMDLIPNLVNTVKGYADFEKGTLTAVIEARAKATAVTIKPDNLSPDEIKKFQNAQDGLSSALGRLMVISEQYPNLKANTNFLELQSQLEGTENRIAVERGRFNDVVKEYNQYIRSFPQNMLAGIYGFQKKGYFEASSGADKAPEVKF
ncbi:MAG: LemA family protein [Bacteroidota bacterium]|nr:LemA family protein [Bacteroidota bacterium]